MIIRASNCNILSKFLEIILLKKEMTSLIAPFLSPHPPKYFYGKENDVRAREEINGLKKHITQNDLPTGLNGA